MKVWILKEDVYITDNNTKDRSFYSNVYTALTEELCEEIMNNLIDAAEEQDKYESKECNQTIQRMYSIERQKVFSGN